VAEAVYLLCSLTCLACVILLYRGYVQSGVRLLYWSALCFLGLFLNNLLLFFDFIITPQLDFSVSRNLTGLTGVLVLLYGMIWDEAK
jgi:hypothetical protein